VLYLLWYIERVEEVIVLGDDECWYEGGVLLGY